MAGRGFDKDNLILSDLPSIQSDKEYTDIHTIADSFMLVWNVQMEYSNLTENLSKSNTKYMKTKVDKLLQRSMER